MALSFESTAHSTVKILKQNLDSLARGQMQLLLMEQCGFGSFLAVSMHVMVGMISTVRLNGK